jgi:hypothetical protein
MELCKYLKSLRHILEISLQAVRQLLQMFVKQRCAALSSLRGEKKMTLINFGVKECVISTAWTYLTQTA